jgi:general secretion pathway protein A
VYLSFYGLAEKPFNTTPDPRFLFLTPSHREALSQLVYGAREGTGVIVLTGEVGTGKTTLLRTLLDRLDRTVAVAFVVTPMLGFEGLLEYILEDLGVEAAGPSPAQRLIALHGFLVQRARTGQRTLVIIDEAQHLAPTTLEQIRLLSNFETGSEKLLQIVLAGQPELMAKLALPELRQLKQRVGLCCRIRPLTAPETAHYVRTRLRVAGAPNPRLFTERALARVHRYAGGIPRTINLLCEHSLLIGYADQVRRIDRGVVAEARRALRADEGAGAERGAALRQWTVGRWRWLLGAGAVAAGAAGSVLWYRDAAAVLGGTVFAYGAKVTQLFGGVEALFGR